MKKLIEQIIDKNSYGIKEYTNQLAEALSKKGFQSIVKNFNEPLKKESIKIFHFSNSTRKILIPLIKTKSNDSYVIYHDICPRSKWIPNFLSNIIFNIINKKSKKIIVHSKFAKKLLITKFRMKEKSKVEIIPHGTRVHQKINEFKRVRLRKKYGFSEKDKITFMLGSITKSRNQLKIIKEILKSKIKNLKILISGNVKDKEFLEIIKGNKNIKYFGFSTNKVVGDIYQMSNCLLIYRKESVGESSGPIAYALGFGLPILVNDIGSFPEMISEGGIIYKNERDIGNSLQKIIEKETTLRKKSKLKGDEISWDNFVKKLEWIIK